MNDVVKNLLAEAAGIKKPDDLGICDILDRLSNEINIRAGFAGDLTMLRHKRRSLRISASQAKDSKKKIELLHEVAGLDKTISSIEKESEVLIKELKRIEKLLADVELKVQNDPVVQLAENQRKHQAINSMFPVFAKKPAAKIAFDILNPAKGA